MARKRSQKRIEYKTGINKIDFQKFRSKTLNKEIQNFNSRLKNFLGKGLISKDTYTTLFFNKEKKDYYNSSIFNRKQLNEFVRELKNLNKKTIQMSKKYPDFTKWEMDILKKRKKYFEKYADIYRHDYSDIKFNVNKLGRELYFQKVLATKFVIQDRILRYREAVKEAYKHVFGAENKNIEKLTDEQLDELSLHPNFDIHGWYYPFTAKERERQKKVVDDLINKKLKNKSKKREKISQKERNKKLLELFDNAPTYYANDEISFD